MIDLIVRDVPESVYRALVARAALHERSLEAEARAILIDSADNATDFVGHWLEATEQWRGDWDFPHRSGSRPTSLG